MNSGFIRIKGYPETQIPFELPEVIEADEFLPYVALKSSELPEDMVIPDFNKKVTLSNFLDVGFREHELIVAYTDEKKISLPFSITKGCKSSKDNDGFLTVRISDPNIKMVTPTQNPFTATYYSDIKLDITIDSTESMEFYIDFYAHDNKQDILKGEWMEGDHKNVFCGRIKVGFHVPNTSKVGLRLTSNIENLPLAPNNYTEPSTFYDPEKSFEVANTYQNSFGMCFAVSMARVRKAYLDEFCVEVISLDINSFDFKCSGTVTHKIPDQYFGYGVGGALAAKGYAELINEEQIWAGELQEGAMLQYWYDTNNIGLEALKQAIKNTINKIDDDNFDGGHSVIFKSYIYDASEKIIGLRCYDYSGIEEKYSISDKKIFLGANLKDIE